VVGFFGHFEGSDITLNEVSPGLSQSTGHMIARFAHDGFHCTLFQPSPVLPPISKGRGSHCPKTCNSLSLANPLFSPHPNLLVGAVGSIIRQFRGRRVTQLHFPHLELVIAAVCLAREDIERPAVLRTRDSRAERDAKVFNVKEAALGKWERRVGALLGNASKVSLVWYGFKVPVFD
jgi:hypothetical protein